MIKKIFLATLIFAATLVVFSSFKMVIAGSTQNTTGWAWGGSEESSDGSINDNESGFGWMSMNNLTDGASSDYGVNIPSVDGDLSGYGWSESVGWIDFNSANMTGCPLLSYCYTKRIGNKIEGWARIVGIKDALASGNSGGWEGWIALGGNNVLGPRPESGVSINTATNKLAGYGWSSSSNGSAEMGWIDFSGINIGSSGKILNATLSAAPSNCIGCDLPFNPVLKVEINRTTSTTTPGTMITYNFDCQNDGIFEDTFSSIENSFLYSKCSYSTYKYWTASVTIEQDSATVKLEANIPMTGPICGDSIIQTGEACDNGASNGAACPAECNSTTCKSNNCGSVGGSVRPTNYKEVNP